MDIVILDAVAFYKGRNALFFIEEMQLFRVFGAAFIHISLGRMGNQLTAENRTVYAVVCDVNMTFCNIVTLITPMGVRSTRAKPVALFASMIRSLAQTLTLARQRHYYQIA